MKTGSWGTFVIPWSQTETDGQMAAPLGPVTAGALWRWTGRAVRVDGPQDLLVLDGAEGAEDRRRRAASMVRRLIKGVMPPADGAGPARPQDAADFLPDHSFVVTDGRASFALMLIDRPPPHGRLVMVLGDLPPADCDLWVVRSAIDPARLQAQRAASGGGVICFAPGTSIATPRGPRPIEALRPGDQVLTRDNGPQAVLWLGHRRMTGARLHVMPDLRPIRIRTGAIGLDEPDRDLIVSPGHRMLLRGASARALFSTDEVLVEARALVNDRSILIDRSLHAVTYVHLLLESHNLIWANGMLTESFHPAHADLATIAPDQRATLEAVLPGIAVDPDRYGGLARRNLSPSEAAILRHDMGI